MLRYLVAHLVLAVSFLPFITSSYAGDHPDWPTDAYGNYALGVDNTTDAYYGNYTPRVGNTTDANGDYRPRVDNTTDTYYGNYTPRVGNPDWTTDAFGNPTPRVEPPHKNEIPFHPGC